MSFGFETTTDEVLEGIDLDGVRAIVTGASGGLGEETARALASKGAHVTLTARDLDRGEAAAEAIRESTGNSRVEVAELELAEPDSVRAFAAAWLAANDGLQLLINNAGVMACPLMRTAEGWEMQFATNHLGHFLLTGLLLPALRQGAPARVVNLSSAGHKLSPVVFDDIHFHERPYDKWGAYGQSKTANILFSVALDDCLAGSGIRAYAVHPGGIQTDLGRHLQESDIAALMERAGAGSEGIRYKTIPQGAATSVWAATAPELEDTGGLYLEDCGIGELVASGDLMGGGYFGYAVDRDAARQLWELSEQSVGPAFAAAFD